MRAPYPVMSLLIGVGQVACSGTLSRTGTVDHSVGRASLHDIMIEVPAVLQRHGYAIYENRPTASTLYIETGWQERAPFDDEADQGVDYARTRFIARGRKAGPAIYSLTITAENQVRTHGDTAPEIAVRLASGWSTMTPTSMYKAYVREITTEIELKVDAGVRTYGARPSPAAPPARPATRP